MSISVKPFQDSDAPAWDAFVYAHPHGSPFHLTAWKLVIQQTFPYQPRYLLARDASGAIRGVLPLFLVDTFLTGKVLISSPFAVYGGILAADTPTLHALGAELRSFAEAEAVQYAELRNAWPEQCLGFTPIDRYVTFTKPLAPTATDDDLLATVSKKTRNMVRKSLKSPFSSRSTTSLDHFYRLLVNNYRRLGTPVFPRAFFARIQQHFAASVDIREILIERDVAAAALNFYFRDSMHTYYAASDPNFLAHAPNNFMYFDFLRWAGNAGFAEFDFGRSKKDTGTFEFKRHWGTVMRELPYEVLLVRRQQPPNFSPKNPKFELAIRLWQRLPIPLTRLLGPRLIQLFP
jgi:FemAB-related protein (PEP-CTERM system-associated)